MLHLISPENLIKELSTIIEHFFQEESVRLDPVGRMLAPRPPAIVVDEGADGGQKNANSRASMSFGTLTLGNILDCWNHS